MSLSGDWELKSEIVRVDVKVHMLPHVPMSITSPLRLEGMSPQIRVEFLLPDADHSHSKQSSSLVCAMYDFESSEW